MGDQPSHVTLSEQQVQELNQKLTEMRHNVNNHLAMIVAASELVRRKPETASRFVNTFVDQPQKIADEVRRFSNELETLLNIGRGG